MPQAMTQQELMQYETQMELKWQVRNKLLKAMSQMRWIAQEEFTRDTMEILIPEAMLVMSEALEGACKLWRNAVQSEQTAYMEALRKSRKPIPLLGLVPQIGTTY